MARRVFSHDTDSSKIINCTIAYNSHEGIYENNDTLLVKNSIIYFKNGTNQVTGNIRVSYSNIQNGYEGEDNINYNPVFYNDTTLRILEGSPCIDKRDPYPIYNDIYSPISWRCPK